ncbi:alcohol dehydrogenase catalytic domain-containing protein [Leisingera sp. SS27]|uniref:alcohol dehydrogenase catalytic domain-containing protein n=1 Tax=Leisingera sp. SS27 TaxID=2979462 RepID=UPI00232B89C1|nr:alcohol dehydrogenase catalytic domain-containing protein [Leisingera sp. SS27]MDC0657765.1 alcohol dehydrogenase catalytic domain-containing protein [Leisingera sp. SS27]
MVGAPFKQGLLVPEGRVDAGGFSPIAALRSAIEAASYPRSQNSSIACSITCLVSKDFCRPTIASNNFFRPQQKLEARMKAAIIERFGKANVFPIGQLPRPVPKPGELLIRVHASSVNPVDSGVRSGKILPGDPAHFPMLLGWDAAGTVEALGANTNGLAPGDRVMAISPQRGSPVGTHTELTAPPASQVMKIADTASFTTAAAVPEVLPGPHWQHFRHWTCRWAHLS